jgi:uroporphyrin-III C-methyltransferase
MGVANQRAIQEQMLAAGWQPRTPASVVFGASRPGGAEWHGTLDTLGSIERSAPDDLPGIIVVGAVAGLAGILSTRPAHQDSFSDRRLASAAT